MRLMFPQRCGVRKLTLRGDGLYILVTTGRGGIVLASKVGTELTLLNERTGSADGDGQWIAYVEVDAIVVIACERAGMMCF
jgi:hypothetical protein